MAQSSSFNSEPASKAGTMVALQRFGSAIELRPAKASFVGSNIDTRLRRSFDVPSVFMLKLVLVAGGSNPPFGFSTMVALSAVMSATRPVMLPPSAMACRFADAGWPGINKLLPSGWAATRNGVK